jgi:ADP-heptose:LPS heptosyltransferase
MTGRDILIIRHGALGDFIQSIGPVQAIRRHHRDDRITLLTTAPFAALAEACPDIDRVWLDDRPGFLQVSNWWGLRRRLRSANFAWVYDLQTSARSSFYRRFLPAPGPNWSGIAPGASHLHDNPDRDRLHTVERQREQLAAAGIADVPDGDLNWLTSDITRFDLPERFALLIAGGSAQRPEKRWPATAFAQLARRLSARDITPVLLGGPDEVGLSAHFDNGTPDLTGRTSYADIASLARAAVCTVGNDTGPSHIAAAAGCPTLVLFSSASDPALCAPRGGRVAVMRQTTLDELDPDEVWSTVVELIG